MGISRYPVPFTGAGIALALLVAFRIHSIRYSISRIRIENSLLLLPNSFLFCIFFDPSSRPRNPHGTLHKRMDAGQSP